MSRLSGGGEFSILNAINPLTIGSLGAISISGNVNDVYASGNFSYLGTDGSNNYQVWDISNPSNMSLCPNNALWNTTAPITGIVADSGWIFVSLTSSADPIRVIKY